MTTRDPARRSRWVMVNCAGETLTESHSGGIAAWVLGVCRAADRSGAPVHVVTKRHPAHAAVWPGAVEVDYPWPSFPGHTHVDRLLRRRRQTVHPWQLLWERRVLRALRATAADPCDVLFHNDPELAVVVARALPHHRVWHLLHNTNPIGTRWHPEFGALVRPLAVSTFIAGWLEAHVALPAGAVRVVPGGVDTALFAPGPKAGPPLITYAGLFNERKAPDLVLAAAEVVARRAPALRFQVALCGATHYGPEDVDVYGRELRAAADRLRQAGVPVALPGFLPRAQLAQALADASIHVVPSRCDEAFGLSALEGMSTGAATVVADRGGLPEVVGDAGVVVRPDDAEALADVLLPLLVDCERRQALAAAGRQRAEQLTWAHSWRRLCELQDGAPDRATATR